MNAVSELTALLLSRLAQVRENLGAEPAADLTADARFADVLDSMGMVEFLMVVAADCGVTPTAIEECVGRKFGTLGELAGALRGAGWTPQTPPGPRTVASALAEPNARVASTLWLTAAVAHLPETVQLAAFLDAALQRPAGWLESHAGIRQRRVWGDADALASAVAAGHAALAQAGLEVEEVGALLVTSEAPPLLTGLAAALHHRLDLRPTAVALEVGGACTGFLAALWLAQTLVPRLGAVLVIAVEAPSRLLPVQPGPAGEAAALFGDAAAAAVLCDHPGAGNHAVSLADVVLGVAGDAGKLIQVQPSPVGVELHLDGPALAERAVRTMAQSVRDVTQAHGLEISDLTAVVAHGGNGRMPALLARQLGLPPAQVWSSARDTGNVGSASLPIAWALQQPCPLGAVAWTAVGAGLAWGAALLHVAPYRSA